MKSLPIVWQRLVSGGRTCERCGATQIELDRAIATLRQALLPLGIEPQLQSKDIDDATFRANPGESNRIWIAGRPMEDWLDATVSSSSCCSVCGESECRTVKISGTTFETIPERLILKAALIASAQLLDDPTTTSVSVPT